LGGIPKVYDLGKKVRRIVGKKCCGLAAKRTFRTFKGGLSEKGETNEGLKKEGRKKGLNRR